MCNTHRNGPIFEATTDKIYSGLCLVLSLKWKSKHQRKVKEQNKTKKNLSYLKQHFKQLCVFLRCWDVGSDNPAIGGNITTSAPKIYSKIILTIPLLHGNLKRDKDIMKNTCIQCEKYMFLMYFLLTLYIDAKACNFHVKKLLYITTNQCWPKVWGQNNYCYFVLYKTPLHSVTMASVCCSSCSRKTPVIAWIHAVLCIEQVDEDSKISVNQTKNKYHSKFVVGNYDWWRRFNPDECIRFLWY